MTSFETTLMMIVLIAVVSGFGIISMFFYSLFLFGLITEEYKKELEEEKA